MVVQKTDFKENNLCVYIEIDSILPQKPEFEFLRERKFRIKTIKLKKVISQGICFPLSILPQGKYKEGDDVTDIIGVIKYDPEGDKERLLYEQKKKSLSDKIDHYFRRYSLYRRIFPKSKRGGWPSFLVKTDEPRCIDGNSNILTEDGIKTIKEICDNKYMGKILSFNLFERKYEYQKILNHYISRNNKDWYEIKLENDELLIISGEHPIWCDDLKCYRQIKNLSGEEILLTSVFFKK